jgi:hypothetical protein
VNEVHDLWIDDFCMWYPHVSLPAMKNPSCSIFNNEDIREFVLFHEFPWQCLAAEGYLMVFDGIWLEDHT